MQNDGMARSKDDGEVYDKGGGASGDNGNTGVAQGYVTTSLYHHLTPKIWILHGSFLLCGKR